MTLAVIKNQISVISEIIDLGKPTNNSITTFSDGGQKKLQNKSSSFHPEVKEERSLVTSTTNNNRVERNY